jgi:hypothetical protein
MWLAVNARRNLHAKPIFGVRFGVHTGDLSGWRGAIGLLDLVDTLGNGSTYAIVVSQNTTI